MANAILLAMRPPLAVLTALLVATCGPVGLAAASDPSVDGGAAGSAPRTDVAPAGTTGDEARTAPRAGTSGSGGAPLAGDHAAEPRPEPERSQENAEDAEEPRGPRGVP